MKFDWPRQHYAIRRSLSCSKFSKGPGRLLTSVMITFHPANFSDINETLTYLWKHSTRINVNLSHSKAHTPFGILMTKTKLCNLITGNGLKKGLKTGRESDWPRTGILNIKSSRLTLCNRTLFWVVQNYERGPADLEGLLRLEFFSHRKRYAHKPLLTCRLLTRRTGRNRHHHPLPKKDHMIL